MGFWQEPELWIGLGLVALGWLSRVPGVTSHLPRPVVKILGDAKRRAEVMAIVAGIARYVNLSNEERNAHAIRALAAWLKGQGIGLKEHELRLLVEAALHLVKRRGGTA